MPESLVEIPEFLDVCWLLKADPGRIEEFLFEAAADATDTTEYLSYKGHGWVTCQVDYRVDSSGYDTVVEVECDPHFDYVFKFYMGVNGTTVVFNGTDDVHIKCPVGATEIQVRNGLAAFGLQHFSHVVADNGWTTYSVRFCRETFGDKYNAKNLPPF